MHLRLSTSNRNNRPGRRNSGSVAPPARRPNKARHTMIQHGTHHEREERNLPRVPLANVSMHTKSNK